MSRWEAGNRAPSWGLCFTFCLRPPAPWAAETVKPEEKAMEAGASRMKTKPGAHQTGGSPVSEPSLPLPTGDGHSPPREGPSPFSSPPSLLCPPTAPFVISPPSLFSSVAAFDVHFNRIKTLGDGRGAGAEATADTEHFTPDLENSRGRVASLSPPVRQNRRGRSPPCLRRSQGSGCSEFQGSYQEIPRLRS